MVPARWSRPLGLTSADRPPSGKGSAITAFTDTPDDWFQTRPAPCSTGVAAREKANWVDRSRRASDPVPGAVDTQAVVDCMGNTVTDCTVRDSSYPADSDRRVVPVRPQPNSRPTETPVPAPRGSSRVPLTPRTGRRKPIRVRRDCATCADVVLPPRVAKFVGEYLRETLEDHDGSIFRDIAPPHPPAWNGLVSRRALPTVVIHRLRVPHVHGDTIHDLRRQHACATGKEQGHNPDPENDSYAGHLQEPLAMGRSSERPTRGVSHGVLLRSQTGRDTIGGARRRPVAAV